MKSSEKINSKPPAGSPAGGSAPLSENIQELYEYVQGSLSFIETKNGVFVALLGGLIATIISFSAECENNLWLYLSTIPPVAALAFLLLSFYPLKPRKRKGKARHGSCDSLCLFRCENIAKLSGEQLSRCLSGELNSHKIEYIRSASKIAARKYRLSRIATKLLFALYAVYAAAWGVERAAHAANVSP
jgi:hypothetical protein